MQPRVAFLFITLGLSVGLGPAQAHPTSAPCTTLGCANLRAANEAATPPATRANGQSATQGFVPITPSQAEALLNGSRCVRELNRRFINPHNGVLGYATLMCREGPHLVAFLYVHEGVAHWWAPRNPE